MSEGSHIGKQLFLWSIQIRNFYRFLHNINFLESLKSINRTQNLLSKDLKTHWFLSYLIIPVTCPIVGILTILVSRGRD